MSEYLPWSEGNPAICQRCGLRGALAGMVADGNVPGMRVHPKCRDDFDPWRLPARKTEHITLQYPRPDISITDDVPAYGYMAEIVAEDLTDVTLESGELSLPEDPGPRRTTYLG